MPFDNVYREKKMPNPLRQTWLHFHTDNLSMVGFYGVIILIILCFIGNVLSPYELNQQFFGHQLLPPSWSRHGNVSFFLGTDDLGRDILSRLFNGVAPTFGSAVMVTLASSLVAFIIGGLAGITDGLRSAVLKHLLDTLLFLPSLLLAIVVVAFTGPSLKYAMLAVWLALLPHMVRTTYDSVHAELEKEYIVALRLDGASTWFIVRKAILPNIAGTLVSASTRALSIAILEIATLGFLNLGAQIPSSEWGAMLGDSLELIYVAPWTVMLPGTAIMLSVLLVNLLGDGLCRAIDASVE